MPAKGWRKPPGYEGYKHRTRVDKTLTQVPTDTGPATDDSQQVATTSASADSAHVSTRTRSAQPKAPYVGQDSDAPSEYSEESKEPEEVDEGATSEDSDDVSLAIRATKKKKKASARVVTDDDDVRDTSTDEVQHGTERLVGDDMADIEIDDSEVEVELSLTLSKHRGHVPP